MPFILGDRFDIGDYLAHTEKKSRQLNAIVSGALANERIAQAFLDFLGKRNAIGVGSGLK